MKVLVISNIYPSVQNPHQGTFVKNFVEGLEKFDAYVDVISLGRLKAGVLWKACSYMLFLMKVVSSLIRSSRKYDVVYFHYGNHTLLPLVLVPKKILDASCMVVNFHGGDLLPENRLNAYVSGLTFRFIKYFDLVVVPSPYFSDFFVEKKRAKGLDDWDVEIFVSPSGGVDVNRFTDFERQRPYRFGYVSRLDHGKGWDVFLKAFHQFNENVDASCIIAGGGKEVSDCKRLVKELGLEHKVELRGPVPHAEMPDILNTIDCLVFPTRRASESLGLVGLEAMSCGCILIASEVGGVASYVEDDVNGLLFDASSVDNLCEKMMRFIDMGQEERKGVVAEAKRTVSRYSSHYVAEKVYRKLKSMPH